MNHLNSVLIEGYIIKKPLFSTLDDGPDKGKYLYQFTIASNQFLKKGTRIEKEVSFFKIQAWGKTGESVRELEWKGREVKIIGRLKQTKCVGKKGEDVANFVIEAEHIEFRPK